MCSALGIPGTENIFLNISETTSYFCEKTSNYFEAIIFARNKLVAKNGKRF